MNESPLDARLKEPPRAGMQPDLPPPDQSLGTLGWLRQNLFSSPSNTLLTLACAYLVYVVVTPFFEWAVLNATIEGNSREDCDPDGACWVFVKVRLYQFIYGFYPKEEVWRVNTTLLIPAIGIALLLLPNIPRKAWIGGFLLFIYPVIAFLLLVGGVFGMEVVPTQKWGGLTLTLVIAGFGIVLSLPIGVIMALGRRSDMPVIRGLCTAYIEFIRGVPLITILFMASVMLPLFMPDGVSIDKVLRAMLGIAIFWAAYMAEVVRGGLQAIPKGQYEAAQALGFGYWRRMRLIILPQALKHVIPGIVSIFISLFKDTTLVLIVGLFDLLGIIQAAAADPKWVGFYKEGYVFAAACYWIFCFAMSRYSMSLETKLSTNR